MGEAPRSKSWPVGLPSAVQTSFGVAWNDATTAPEAKSRARIESVCGSLPLATLLKIEGANHAFKAGKQNTMQILVKETVDWVAKIK